MRVRFHKLLMRRQGQSGETLFSAMVAAAILIILVVSAGMGVSNLNKMRRRLQANEASREVDAVLVQMVTQSFTNYVLGSGPTSRCGNINLVKTIPIANVGNLDSTVKTGIAGKFPGDPDYNRCISKAFVASGTAQAASTFYLCYQVNLDSNSLKTNDLDAITRNKGAFLQVVVHLKDLQKDINKACSSIVQNNGQGIEIYYSMKWIMRINQENVVKTTTGAVNAAF